VDRIPANRGGETRGHVRLTKAISRRTFSGA
jgi:hypothetical protein